MSDLMRYARERAAHDPEFAEGLETGYAAFKLGVLLREARESAGLTQAQVAERLGTKKSAISRIENHAADIRLSTLQKYAHAVGCDISLELRPFVSMFDAAPSADAPEPAQPQTGARRVRRRASI
jgi:HTH-type transcriptional regulator / antitoxin HipB